MGVAQLMSLGTSDLAIDLGTNQVMIYVRGRGIVLNEPLLAAVHRATGKVAAVGAEAWHLLYRTPTGIAVIHPFRDGLVADFDIAQHVIRHMIRKVLAHPYLIRPRILVSFPLTVTTLEYRALRNAVLMAGSRGVFMIARTIAAGVGVGLPVGKPTGSAMILVGRRSTEIVVMARGRIVSGISIQVGGDALDRAIVRHMRRERSLLIGIETAEQIKEEIGSAVPSEEEIGAAVPTENEIGPAVLTENEIMPAVLTENEIPAVPSENKAAMEVSGLSALNGTPTTCWITADEIRGALAAPLEAILDAVQDVMSQTPLDLVCDVPGRGIVLAGGGSLLRGFDRLVQREMGLPARTADGAASCKVLGMGKILDDLLNFERLLLPFPPHLEAEMESTNDGACFQHREEGSAWAG